MNKIALITGATDGIGKETALALAKNGLSLHILGRNRDKGNKVLDKLSEINPHGKHKFFAVDLSSIKPVNDFLENYLSNHEQLDVLILNAGIYPEKNTLSPDGIDLTFSVGFISRYLFSIKLNPLLVKSEIGKVVHVNGSILGKIKYDQLSDPKYNKLSSVWQNSVAGALLVYFWKEWTATEVSHIHWNPGIVNTQTVKTQSTMVQLISKWMGMIEPEVAGEMLARQVLNAVSEEVSAKFFSKGKVRPIGQKIVFGKPQFNELVRFAEEFTGCKLKT